MPLAVGNREPVDPPSDQRRQRLAQACGEGDRLARSGFPATHERSDGVEREQLDADVAASDEIGDEIVRGMRENLACGADLDDATAVEQNDAGGKAQRFV